MAGEGALPGAGFVAAALTEEPSLSNDFAVVVIHVTYVTATSMRHTRGVVGVNLKRSTPDGHRPCRSSC